MKKLLFALLMLPSLAFGQAISANVWEKAAYGSVPGVSYVRLFGLNGAIPATYETVWPESADYTPLTAAMSTPYCASANANDTSAGSGARTMSITGLKTDFTRFTETVTLNGQTSVNLATTNVQLIDGGEILTTGNGLTNAGIIQCGTGANTSGDPAVTHFYIPAGSVTAVTTTGHKSASFIYGVPANKTLLCRNIQASSVFATAASGMDVAIFGYTNNDIVKLYFSQKVHNTGANPSVAPDLIRFPEKTIIVGKLAGSTGSNVGPATLSAECLLIDKSSSNSNQLVF